MGFTIAQGLVLVLLTASTMAVSTANKGWQFGNWPYRGPYHPNNTQTSNRIIVGDSYHWNFGFNYTNWAIKHGPFYLNDTLGEHTLLLLLVLSLNFISTLFNHKLSIWILKEHEKYVNLFCLG